MRSSSYESQHAGSAWSDAGEKEEQAFFEKPEKKEKNAAFFQTKLNIGQPGDAYEKEADQMADKVVSQAPAAQDVQQKEDKSIQRLATDKEEEKAGTNDARMLRDKEIQEKPDVQHKSETSGGGTASAALSSRIESSSGKGSSLAASAQSEMGDAFHADFSGVKIHTDAESVSMNKELGAQAFTHGSDVYFNTGKYDPESRTGKHLLAHELTHVVQQGHAGSKKDQQ